MKMHRKGADQSAPFLRGMSEMQAMCSICSGAMGKSSKVHGGIAGLTEPDTMGVVLSPWGGQPPPQEECRF